MAGTLRKLVTRDPPPEDWREDAESGLAIIHDRAESLSRFMESYARLARLPPPNLREASPVDIVQRAAALFGQQIALDGGPEVFVKVDGDQIEQVLINLIKNAVEAAAGKGVCVSWRARRDAVELTVEDEGPGLASTQNLWVPFFTTKPGGTGLGLVLAREIVENHGGEIALGNRASGRGCVATVSLPKGSSTGSARGTLP